MAIRVFDNTGKLIAELMDASASDVLTFIDKGFSVVDLTTSTPLDRDVISNMIGCSDCVISAG